MNKYQFKPLTQTGALSEDDSKKYFSTVGLAVFAFLFVGFVSSYAAAILLTKFAPAWLENTAITNSLSLITQYGLGLPAALYFLRKLPRDTSPSESLGAKNFLGLLCVSITFLTVGSSMSSILTDGLSLLFGRNLTNPLEESATSDSVLVNLIFMAILAPIIEELVFRKILCDRLLPLGEGYAVFLSAAIFGLVHGNFFQFFYAFLIGIVFSYIYVKTGRVRYTIAIHMIINLFGGVFMSWIIDTLSPVLTEELYVRLTEVVNSGDMAAMEALAEELSPYMLPIFLWSGYELLLTVLSMAGVFIFFRHLKNVKFRAGLLPPEKKHRIANIFCNGGVALAITAFAVIFVVSLL